MSEIEILVYMAIWTVALALPGAAGLVLAGGFPVGLGNRDQLPEMARGLRGPIERIATK
jgi:hypothetical protein